MSECEKHLSDCLRVGGWKSLPPYIAIYRDITEFVARSRAAQKPRCSFRTRFDLENHYQAVCQQQDLSRLHQKSVLTVSCLASWSGRIFDAVLFMDNCAADLTDHMIRFLTEARVHVITFAPYTI
jgi:hypothetical protein